MRLGCRALVAVLMLGALGVAAPASAATVDDRHRALRSLILVPGRTVGLPVLHVSGPASSSTRVATLDLCDARPPSEALRTAREERYYLSSAVGLDVEVVAYRAGGAARALADVRAVVASSHGTCRDHGHLLTGLHTAPAPRGSLPGAVLVVGSEHVGNGGIDQLSELYQAKDDVLSIVYAQGFDARVGVVARRVQAAATARLRAGAAAVQ